MADKAEKERIIQNYFDAFAEGNIEKATALLTDDVVWHVDGDIHVFSTGIMSGKQQIAKWMRLFPEKLTPITFTINQSLIDGNEVVIIGNFCYCINKTGHFISSDMVIHFTLHNNKIAHYHIYEDSLALSQGFNYYNNYTKKELRLNGTRYAYSDRGNGPTLIFMHSLFADRSSFEAQLSELEKNYRCIAFDLPGHGVSGYPKEGWTLKELAQDISLFIKELRLEPVTLIGHSQGGMIAILISALYPQLVSGMVLISTSARQEYSERIERWHQIKEIIMRNSFDEKESLFKTIQSIANTPHWLEANDTKAMNERKLMHLYDNIGLCFAIDAATIKRQDIRTYLPLVKCNTLVICGDHDKATPLDVHKEICDSIPHCQLVLLKGVAHHPPTEAPIEVLQQIRLFLCNDN